MRPGMPPVPSAPLARSRALQDYLLLLVLAAVWSSSFMLIKIAVATIAPMTLAAMRLAIAAVLLLGYALARGETIPFDVRSWGVFLFIGLFGNALPFSLIGWGEIHIDSGLAAILMGIMPVATAALAHSLIPDEPFNVWRGSGIAVGFGGLLVLVGVQALGGLGTALLAQLAVLLGAVCYAVTTVFARRHAHLSGRVMAAGATMAGTLLVAPLAMVLERPWDLTPSPASLTATLVLGLVPTGLATLLYFHLIRAIGATGLSQVNYLIPMMGAGWGIWLLGERPGARAALALALIVTGIALVNRGTRQPGAAQPGARGRRRR